MKEENHKPYRVTMDVESKNNNDAVGVANEELQSSSSPPEPESNFDHYQQMLKQTPKMVIIFVMLALSMLVIYHSSIVLPFYGYHMSPTIASNYHANSLSRILKDAAMSNNTVIITSLNDAWAEPQSMFDLLLKSFRIGNQTERFLKHLVVVNVDQNAYARCLKLHPHCYHLNTNGSDFSGQADFMTADYLKIVWRKIDFLGKDADIMWFRDPFSQFDNADFQTACDNFNGNPFDWRNLPNTGFSYVKSNEKTIQLYKYWYKSRMNYPGLHDQDVFNRIKFHPFVLNIGLRIRFLDTAYFGGFCEPSQDLNKVCTMHANCCVGLENKVHDLGIMLDDWRKYIKSLVNQTTTGQYKGSWTVPQLCRGSLRRPRPRPHPHAPKKKVGQGSKS
ncbi:putative nucleotide-diphospho-sugar transferase [Helianthus annuus]|nr:putative nucleotide-diphospho-sugar transferase [Helianthus annuus]